MIMANEDWTSSKRQQISAERKDTSKMRLGKEMTSFFMRKSDAGEKGAPQVQNHVRFSGLGNWVYKAKTRRQKKKKKKKNPRSKVVVKVQHSSQIPKQQLPTQ